MGFDSGSFGSFAAGMLMAAVAGVLLVVGFGFGLQLEGRFRRWAMPALGLIIALAPPLGVLLEGRDLTKIDFLSDIDAGGLGAWLLRLSTASVVGLALLRIVGRLFRTQADAGGRDQATDAMHVGMPLLAAFVAYYVGNSLLPAAFGTVPSFALPMLYPLAVVMALFMSRHYEPSDWLDAVKWALLAILLLGFVASAITPEVTTQFDAREARLPGVKFRYWGIGSNPNSIAPLALLLMMLTIHRPFRSVLVSLTAFVAGAVVLLLAQSQTTWGAAALVLVPFAMYRLRSRHGPATGGGWTLNRMLILLGALTAVAIAVSVLMIELRVGSGMRNDLGNAILASRKGQEISDLSGRTQIWMIAIEVWKGNPLFGYGPTLWGDAFRAAWRVPNAFHAHNQFMQSLAMGGIAGMTGLLAYLLALIVGAVRATRASRGLAPALVVVLLVRSITEVPLELSTVLLGDFLFQITCFAVVLGYLIRAERQRYAPEPGARRRRRSRRSARGSSSGAEPGQDDNSGEFADAGIGAGKDRNGGQGAGATSSGSGSGRRRRRSSPSGRSHGERSGGEGMAT